MSRDSSRGPGDESLKTRMPVRFLLFLDILHFITESQQPLNFFFFFYAKCFAILY